LDSHRHRWNDKIAIREGFMKVAVTGAGGHVGNNLCRALLSQGAIVKAFCHQDVRALENLPLDLVYGNVLDPDSLLACFQEVDVVYHLASIISIEGGARGKVREVNEQGTRNVIEACLKAGIQRLVHFSSVHALVQTPLEQTLDENRPLVNETGSIYDQSKAEAERIVLESVKHGLDAIIISPSAIIGPHDYKPSLMGMGLIALYRGSLPALVQGGFNWVDVRDVVEGAIRACELGETGGRFLLSGTWADIPMIAEMVEAISGNPQPRFTSPIWLARLGLPFIRALTSINGARVVYTSESLDALEGANRNISYEKAAKLLKYQPRPLQETLQDTFRWFRKIKLLV
jgi:dihydroflavonol-4-reductase